jgi:hypothetical protein
MCVRSLLKFQQFVKSAAHQRCGTLMLNKSGCPIWSSRLYFVNRINYALTNTTGAAERISSLAWSAYLAKFFTNNWASSLAFLS